MEGYCGEGGEGEGRENGGPVRGGAGREEENRTGRSWYIVSSRFVLWRSGSVGKVFSLLYFNYATAGL